MCSSYRKEMFKKCQNPDKSSIAGRLFGNKLQVFSPVLTGVVIRAELHFSYVDLCKMKLHEANKNCLHLLYVR
jgi:hypothetical protein